MKGFGFLAGLLGVWGLTLLAGCATESASRSARAAPPATYAVIAFDNQGVLSPDEFKKVEVGVIQYLFDEGYVRAQDKYVSDLLNAEVVFRVRIAWQGAKGGFIVTAVKPTFSPRPYAQSETGGGTATPDVPWYAPGGWYDNPWSYGDYYGPDFWPYAGFAGLSAFAPIYGGRHGGHHEPDRDHGRAGDHDRRGRPDRDRWDHGDRPPDYYASSGGPVWNPGGPNAGSESGNRDGGEAHERGNRPYGRSHPGDRHHISWAGHPASFGSGVSRSYGPVRTSAPARWYARPSRSYSTQARSYSPPPRSFAAPARSYSQPASAPADRGPAPAANSRKQEK
jgi:hypothetical protein